MNDITYTLYRLYRNEAGWENRLNASTCTVKWGLNASAYNEMESQCICVQRRLMRSCASVQSQRGFHCLFTCTSIQEPSLDKNLEL